MKTDLDILKNEYERLIEIEKNGEQAKAVRDFIYRFCENTINSCKEKFYHLSINNLNNIASDEIFMLQLNIKVTNDIKAFLEKNIYEGNNAISKLKELRRGTE